MICRGRGIAASPNGAGLSQCAIVRRTPDSTVFSRVNPGNIELPWGKQNVLVAARAPVRPSIGHNCVFLEIS